MRFVIQRVSEAKVTVDQQTTGAIQKGLLVLVGVCDTDTRQTADLMLHKLWNMRIFQDADGKTNLALKDVGGSLLLVSQFTLYADCRKGNRPSFVKAGNPQHAEELYEYLLAQCAANGYPAQRGVFGAHMQVSLVNAGPFTIWLDSEELEAKSH